MDIEKLCKKTIPEQTVVLLAQIGARAFCIYCNYIFDKIPILPVTCPKCKTKLKEFCLPIFEIIKRNK